MKREKTLELADCSSDGETVHLPLTLHLKAGDFINNRYQLIEFLGKGGFGMVFSAYDPVTGSQVALKFLDSVLSADPEKFKRVQREITTARKVRDPRLVAIYGLEEWQGHFYLVMEMVDGKTLEHHFHGPVPWARIRPVFLEICRAVFALHRAGIIHRDLKPSNIMIASDGRVKLLDFGLAKEMGENRLTQTMDKIMGSPIYLSPEQILGKELDHRSDIYQLGLILFFLLCGELPYSREASTAQILHHKLKQNGPNWPKGLPKPEVLPSYILEQFLAQKPSDRPGSLEPVIVMLEQGSVSRLKRWCRRIVKSRWLRLGLAVGLLVLLMGVVFNLQAWKQVHNIVGEGETVRAVNRFGATVWEKEFPGYKLAKGFHFDTRTWPSMRKASFSSCPDELTLLYLANANRAPIGLADSIASTDWDDQVVYFDERGRLINQFLLRDYLNLDTASFFPAVKRINDWQQDIDGDGMEEYAVRMMQRHFMYPSALLLLTRTNGPLLYCAAGAINNDWKNVYQKNAGIWHLTAMSYCNPFAHLVTLGEIVFDEAVNRRTGSVFRIPYKPGDLLPAESWLVVLPRRYCWTQDNQDWSEGGILKIKAYGADDRMITLNRNGSVEERKAGNVLLRFQDDPEMLKRVYRAINVYYKTNTILHNPVDAKPYLDQAMAEPVQNPWLKSGLLFFKSGWEMAQGDLSSAEISVRKGLEQDPESIDLFQRSCEIRVLQGRLDEVIEQIAAIKDREPSRDRLNFWGITMGDKLFLSYLYLRRGRFSEAEALLSGVNLNTTGGAGRISVSVMPAIIRFYGGDYDAAFAHLSEPSTYLSSNFTVEDGHLMAGRALLMKGDNPDLLGRIFQDLYANSRDRKHLATLSLAWVKACRGEPDAEILARNGFAETTRRAGSDFESHVWFYYDAYVYGMTMERLGHTDEAKKGFRLCVESGPFSHLAKLAREKMGE